MADSVGPWDWERYRDELSVSPEHLSTARILVERIDEAIHRRGLPWRLDFNQGYIAIKDVTAAPPQTVLGVDVRRTLPPWLWIRVRDDYARRGLRLRDVCPGLEPKDRATGGQIGWVVPSVSAIPDVEQVVLAAEMCRRS